MSSFEPTVPRGPIAAMYSSPGPCYDLPGIVGSNKHDPRSVHPKAAAYSFGGKNGKWKNDCSPGPIYLPHEKIYKNGRDGTPQYSLYSRPKDMKLFKTPGPGSYAPEKGGEQSKLRYPAYSFGVRHRSRTTDNNPGPNAYSLPNMVGQTAQSSKPAAPAFSMTKRSKIGGFHEDLQKTPGPGAYDAISPNIYQDKQPNFSMTGRNMIPGDTTKKPGPGAYDDSQVWAHKNKAPGYSFGIRHSNYIAPLIVEPTE
ncbi:hypothetical protein SNEBB_007635 [Seison nebaliae]|nr:hypothetical protein SNEBB_007635 [Seison nebaliae]